jgi:hypothetical protein
MAVLYELAYQALGGLADALGWPGQEVWPTFGLPAEGRARWCRACTRKGHPGAVNVASQPGGACPTFLTGFE